MKTPDRELYLAKKLVKEWHAKANKAISTCERVEKEFTKSDIKWKALTKKMHVFQIGVCTKHALP